MSNRILKWGPAGFLFAVTLVFSLVWYYRAPFHDHWDIVPYFDRMQDGSLGFSDLFALHGNHWHASGYIVQLGLGQLTNMGHWAESLASVMIAGMGFIALVRILDRSVTLLNVGRAAVWAFGLSAFFLFSLDQAANWLWGWQIAVFINVAGALWAIERLSDDTPSLLSTSFAIVAAACSVYAFGTGWALIPIGYGLLLVNGAWRSRQGIGSLVLWTVFTALLAWHFSLALTDSSAAYAVDSTPDLTDPKALIGLIHYAMNFVASPVVRFARDSSVPAFLIGASIIIWAVWALRSTNKKYLWKGVAPFLALAAYSMGAGLLTALGRWEVYGVKQAFVSRYITFGTFFWIAVFALAVFALAKSHHPSRRVVFGFLGLLFVLKLGNIPSVVQKTVGLSNDIKATALVLAAEYPDVTPEQYSVLHHPLQDIESRLGTLKSHDVSLFTKTPKVETDDHLEASGVD